MTDYSKLIANSAAKLRAEEQAGRLRDAEVAERSAEVWKDLMIELRKLASAIRPFRIWVSKHSRDRIWVVKPGFPLFGEPIILMDIKWYHSSKSPHLKSFCGLDDTHSGSPDDLAMKIAEHVPRWLKGGYIGPPIHANGAYEMKDIRPYIVL